MKLLTQEILKKLPPIYANEEKDFVDVKVITKFFFPAGELRPFFKQLIPLKLTCTAPQIFNTFSLSKLM